MGRIIWNTLSYYTGYFNEGKMSGKGKLVKKEYEIKYYLIRIKFCIRRKLHEQPSKWQRKLRVEKWHIISWEIR